MEGGHVRLVEKEINILIWDEVEMSGQSWTYNGHLHTIKKTKSYLYSSLPFKYATWTSEFCVYFTGRCVL